MNEILDILQNIDVQALDFIRSFVDPNSSLQVSLIKIFSDIEVLLAPLFLIMLWFFGIYKKDYEYKKKALMIFYSIAFCFVIYVIFNQFLPVRPRPELFSKFPPLIDHLPDNSFPSGHAIFMASSCLAFGLFLKNKLITFTLFLTWTLMLLSRIASGVHYPGDILVGLFVWIVFFTIFYGFRNNKIFEKYLLKYPILIAKKLKL